LLTAIVCITFCHITRKQVISVARTTPLGVRVEADVKAAMEMAAFAGGRSVAATAERILREWLVTNGYLGRERAIEASHPMLAMVQDAHSPL
jgi:hypothetical protein